MASHDNQVIVLTLNLKRSRRSPWKRKKKKCGENNNISYLGNEGYRERNPRFFACGD